MKTLILTLTLALGATLGVSARDIITRDTSVLPVAAQIALKDNFKSDVNTVKVDKSFGHIDDYEVTLADGTEISFDKHGIWESIESGVNTTVPSGLIDSTILDYVAQAQPGSKVIGIERERTGNYEITLSNGVEMKFNRNGEFVKYDK